VLLGVSGRLPRLEQLDLIGRADALVPNEAVERHVLVAVEARRRREAGHPCAVWEVLVAVWPEVVIGPDLPANFGRVEARQIADRSRISALGKLTVLT